MKLEIDIQCCNDCPFCEKYEFSDCSYSRFVADIKKRPRKRQRSAMETADVKKKAEINI